MVLERGAIRRSQAISTFGVGALLDLPRASAIVGGLDRWPIRPEEDEIAEPRLAQKLAKLACGALPRLVAPPAPEEIPGRAKSRGIPAYAFPNWFVERQPQGRLVSGRRASQSRRLAHRSALDRRRRLGGRPVVAIRFVRACPRGHVDDFDWYWFVHRGADPCRNLLYLDETGPSGDLSELVVRCGCDAERVVAEARPIGALGKCSGERPWLGRGTREDCDEKARLLIRTATNAWFPQVVSTLSLPDVRGELDALVERHWNVLQVVEGVGDLRVQMRAPSLAAALGNSDESAVLAAIRRRKRGPAAAERPLKQVELDALLDAPEGFGDDVPVDPNFHARRLPESTWRDRGGRAARLLSTVIQVHRLREVVALAGFTRFEAVTRDIDGEYTSDVERAALSIEADWLPAVENRGEGVFVEFAADEVKAWRERAEVVDRVARLTDGQARWNERRPKPRKFPGAGYVLLHTVAHLLIESLSLRCGYPAASIRERIYVGREAPRYGVLLYTASPDAEGTLGGLVEQARRITEHLDAALETAALCSNDPVCAHHRPGDSREERWLHGAACHGCALIAETSCEMANDYLDRALVAPVIGCPDAAFFGR